MNFKAHVIMSAFVMLSSGCDEQRLDLFDAPVEGDASDTGGVEAGRDAEIEVGEDAGVEDASVEDVGDDAGGDAGAPDVTFGAVEVCSGNRHSCAIVEGAMWCWGDNREGQLGAGDREARVGPRRVSGDDWREVECGSSHTCGVRDAGTVWCWGSNELGQLGRGADEVANTPAQALLFDRVSALSVRTTHSCAVTEVGELWCWGRNKESELGQGTNAFDGVDQLETPQRVEAFDDVVDAAVGDGMSCALLASGEVWCWGRNTSGQVGAGSPEPVQHKNPVEVAAPPGRVWSRLYSGVTHVCAFTGAEELYCWGGGESLRFGVEATLTFAPLRVELGLPVERISANVFGACGLSGDARAWCWGLNIDNLLGLGAELGEPTPPGLLPFEGIQALDVGRFHTCLIARDGAARCVGNNPSGQLGVDPLEVPISASWVRPPAPWLDAM